MEPTELPIKTTTKLSRIAWLSRQDKQRTFNNLMHHFNEGSLRDCFNELDGKKAVGVDGIDKQTYQTDLSENLQRLTRRMKQMAWRPGPVREVRIPKPGYPRQMRPLGISNLEDKLVQRMMHKVLEQIYEPVFLDCSYGFRSGRSCHDALKALHQHLYQRPVEVVLDVDLGNFFGTINHSLLMDLVERKIQDRRLLRYLRRMLKAGVLSEGELKISEEGVPQGSICSPMLANIVAHYVIDEWFEQTVKGYCRGQVAMFRYADDIVICCQHRQDAERIWKALGKRLNKYKLKFNEDKTRLVNFSKQQFVCGERQQVFDFLGFTHYWGRSRKGSAIPKVKTSGQRLRQKLKNVNHWARTMRNRYPLHELWKRYCAKLRGHMQYYAMTFNADSVSTFFMKATRLLYKWLNNRSQRRSFTWEQFAKFIKRYPLPPIRIQHSLY